jgi:predicted metal-binding protein
MEYSHDSLQELIRKAIELGVSDVRIIPARSIVVEDRFAEMCASPQCPGYGQGPGCPPHVMKPAEFRGLLARYEHALVFKIDAPTELLLGEERHDVARRIHEIAAAIELLARERGYAGSRGFAAGSCRMIFCADRESCVVLENGGECRFPDQARASLSGIGVNFEELCKAVGWRFQIITKDTTSDEIPMGMMAGMVLIG